jgi:hypothetical protein
LEVEEVNDAVNGGSHAHFSNKNATGDAFSDFNESHNLQDSHGLPSGGFADNKLDRQFFFGSQPISGFELSGKNGVPDLIDDEIRNFAGLFGGLKQGSSFQAG